MACADLIGESLEVFREWEASVVGAYRAKILEAKIRYLKEKSVVLASAIVAAQAQENARLAAEAAERARVEAEARRIADEQARVAAQAELQRLAQQQAARQALFASGSTLVMAANASTLTISGQGIGQLGQDTALLAQAIEKALAALARQLLTGPGVYVAAFLSLALYSSPTADDSHDRTPDRIRYGLGINAGQLGLDPEADLRDIASAQSTVDMPMRLVSEVRENRSVISVISTDGRVVPKSVKVRAATLNPQTGLYEVVLPSMIGGPPAITLTWTPADVPLGENPSSTTPAIAQQPPIHTGVELEPIAVDAQAYPGVLTDLDDLIVWFPAQAGMPPVYVMFNSPYEGATTRGEHSGRMYNPENAGGPTQDLDWTTASVTQEGIELVELHTGRFSPSDANIIMVERLKQIVRGELEITDTDKRFYTHELRELERYRILGVPDGVIGSVWNDAHAATLEDYKLKDVVELLYTPEAIAADFKQMREGRYE
ncbi:S-type pyocin domain-containing protein [Pseudomonas sp. DTU_2021_1001937_2_SI_NGA_ILE_001]|uniref:S-type pyocin domain-containing protein n=1 Tax=Pseudomonas sp. DTU_2021_1001937_2_SI_NGA_ILE_001 TaxID=3077589 RepID=UPI0028FC0AC7|nr:S-type pyocin domain-containing protein [Pseudomonas sp. DTU_2021_1001937_2_SI_NGA_ILE_001]WNW10589.1 S-type pyocin domain-containing protein [Pseudomonas sp. DTU_2021_1001937_2_SI_NGA_ILE_001]